MGGGPDTVSSVPLAVLIDRAKGLTNGHSSGRHGIWSVVRHVCYFGDEPPPLWGKERRFSSLKVLVAGQEMFELRQKVLEHELGY
jgi:hypothetical protein